MHGKLVSLLGKVSSVSWLNCFLRFWEGSFCVRLLCVVCVPLDFFFWRKNAIQGLSLSLPISLSLSLSPFHAYLCDSHTVEYLFLLTNECVGVFLCVCE